MNENNNVTKKRKSFDPSVCFTFFGSWVKSIEAMETEQDRTSKAYRMFKAIADYSMHDEEPEFDEDMMCALWTVIEQQINASTDRRKRNFEADKMNEKYQAIINAIINKPSASLREIGEMTGTDKNMVQRVKRKYEREIQEAISKNSDRDNDCKFAGCTTDGVASDVNNNGITVNNADTDTMGRDNGTDSIYSRKRQAVLSGGKDDDKLPF